jgi:hypothetical protein
MDGEVATAPVRLDAPRWGEPAEVFTDVARAVLVPPPMPPAVDVYHGAFSATMGSAS